MNPMQSPNTGVGRNLYRDEPDNDTPHRIGRISEITIRIVQQSIAGSYQPTIDQIAHETGFSKTTTRLALSNLMRRKQVVRLPGKKPYRYAAKRGSYE